MFLKKSASFNSSSRHKLRLTKNVLAKNNKFIKQIKKGFKNVAGRSTSTGRITTRHNGGMPSVTPWGKPTKGKPTVKYKN